MTSVTDRRALGRPHGCYLVEVRGAPAESTPSTADSGRAPQVHGRQPSSESLQARTRKRALLHAAARCAGAPGQPVDVAPRHEQLTTGVSLAHPAAVPDGYRRIEGQGLQPDDAERLLPARGHDEHGGAPVGRRAESRDVRASPVLRPLPPLSHGASGPCPPRRGTARAPGAATRRSLTDAVGLNRKFQR